METLLGDLKTGLRSLARAPAFTAVAVLALALGTGANTAIFSAVNALLLRPLPFPEPGRLVSLGDGPRGTERGEEVMSEPDLRDLQASKSFSAVAGFTTVSATVTGDGDAEAAQSVVASAALLPLLGVQPAVGRVFTPDDEGPTSARVALVSYSLWKRRFGGDARAIGRSIIVGGKASTIVGVLPQGFRFPLDEEPASVWIPLGQGSLDGACWNQRGAHFLNVIGRLAPGISLSQARAAVDSLWSALAERFPDSNKNRWLRIEPYAEHLTGKMRPALILLMGAVVFVLLIACGNVANLLLARAAVQQRELAVRAALGASRTRIVRQLLTESILLGLFGGALGLLIANWGIDGVRALAPASLQRLKQVQIDAAVLAFTAGLSMLTAVLFGLVPALLSSRPDLHEMMKQGGRAAAGAPHGRLRGALVVAEVALSLLLLIGAGLLGRSFLQVLHRDPGFVPEGVLTATLALPEGRFPGGAARQAFVARLQERLLAVPGAESAAVASTLPFNGDHINFDFRVVGRPPPPPGEETVARAWMASPSYFATLKIPLRKGRLFTDAEAAQGVPVVMISEAFERRWFPQGALGQQLIVNGADGPARTIVGVVGDVRDETLEADAPPAIYLFARSSSFESISIAVRFRNGTSPNAAALRREVAAVDKDLAPDAVKPLSGLVSDALAARRFSLTLLLAFAGVALLLAAVGIYGVMSYMVSQRTRELGIRLALGAAPHGVLLLVLGQGLRLCGLGIALGAAAALGLTRVIQGLVYDVSATDPLTFITLACGVAGVALLATWLPARRAARVAPATVLGAE